MEYILKANPRVLGWLFRVIKDGEWRKMTNEENERLKNDLNWLIIFEYYDFKLQILNKTTCKIKFPDSDWFETEFIEGTFEIVGLTVLFQNSYDDLMNEDSKKWITDLGGNLNNYEVKV